MKRNKLRIKVFSGWMSLGAAEYVNSYLNDNQYDSCDLLFLLKERYGKIHRKIHVKDVNMILTKIKVS